MAIIFQQQIKRQKNLVLVLIFVVIIGGFVFLWNSSIKVEPLKEQQLSVRRFKKIEINFAILDHPLLAELNPLDKIPEFEGEMGRDNPFVD